MMLCNVAFELGSELEVGAGLVGGLVQKSSWSLAELEFGQAGVWPNWS
jgi:hypothetical protein